MDKKKLNRHDFVFLNNEGKKRILERNFLLYSASNQKILEHIFSDKYAIPGIVRRNFVLEKGVPLGFVYYKRLQGNRIRIPALAYYKELASLVTPYDLFSRTFHMGIDNGPFINKVISLYAVAADLALEVGVIGSIGLELLTGLPYVDGSSDLDFIIKASKCNDMHTFLQKAKKILPEKNMDFEVELPNGYGVKLEELFSNTRTVLGKGLHDVVLLERESIEKYL